MLYFWHSDVLCKCLIIETIVYTLISIYLHQWKVIQVTRPWFFVLRILFLAVILIYFLWVVIYNIYSKAVYLNLGLYNFYTQSCTISYCKTCIWSFTIYVINDQLLSLFNIRLSNLNCFPWWVCLGWLL